MSKMYSIIDELCKAHGITVGKMCGILHISRGTLSDLNNDRTDVLSLKTARKIAEYFDVSVDYLYGQDNKKAPTLSKEDERDMARQLESIMAELSQSSALMFDGNPMTDEARDSIMSAMRLGYEAAKSKNKERYTPKKYKKE